MTQSKAALVKRLTELAGEGDYEKWTVQKLHYEIQKFEESQPEPEAAPEPEPEAPAPPAEPKRKSLWQIILGDSSDDD
jgi:hypothetical protein